MDFYLKTTSVYRFVNDDTDEVIGMITDVKKTIANIFSGISIFIDDLTLNIRLILEGCHWILFPFPVKESDWKLKDLVKHKIMMII